MNITIDARLYGLENAGLGRYVMNLVKYLSFLDKSNNYTLILRKKYFEELKLPKSWTRVLADFRHYSFLEQARLPGIIADTKPDLVHFPHFNVPVSYRGKFVVTIHDMLMHRMKGKETTTLSLPAFLIKRLGYRYVFRKAVRDSLNVLVPSNCVKKELVDFYKVSPSKISVTYEGVELGKVFSPVLDKYGIREKYFIYAGNAYPHKNLERAIKAILSLNESRQEKVLFIIACSRSEFTARLESLIARLGAGKYVKFLGFIPDPDLLSLYKSSVGFLFPSFSEGFGLPGLEAISSGTLAVISSIPVFKEIYGQHALYFNPYDFTSITRTLAEALDISPNVRKERVAEGQKFVGKYSWEKMARETLSVYKEAVL